MRRVLEHYDARAPGEAVAEAAYEDPTQPMMEIPTQLVPAVRSLIAKRMAS